MCIFSDEDGARLDERAVEVSGTRIFARAVGPRQRLAYAMRLATAREVAMILPLPVPPRSGEHAIEFIDLSGAPDLLLELEACFQDEPEDDLPCLFDDGDGRTLTVHAVGAFVASYVPTLADFRRVDPRFRLPDRVWQRLPRYDDWGFAVIQLQPGAREVHPIALDFPRRCPDRLFFPTVHVHDGEVHPEAFFDHLLYWQDLPRPARRGAASERAVRADALRLPSPRLAAQSRGLVAVDLPLERLRLHGPRPNEDVWLLAAP